jgi:S-adenosylmethionine-diacylglycerol 3-amino-3-carboxypropyl transferase
LGFTLAFSGLIYPQIWEDPMADLDALSLEQGEHLAAIASGGCNILSYRSTLRCPLMTQSGYPMLAS